MKVKDNYYCFKALNQALYESMESNEKVLLIGEDILDPYGGAFKVAKGLSTNFPHQVYTTPISEAAIVGIANGLSLRGFIPVVEIMFGDFIGLAFDQILNHLSKFNSMYNNQTNSHLVIRTPMGGYRGYGPTHSQSLEKFLFSIPNILVLYPSHLHDLKAMLKRAVINEDKPVIFIENKTLYTEENKFPIDNKIEYFDFHISEDYYPTIILSLNNFTYSDVTIVCFGGITPMVMEQAVNLLTEKEIFCELVILSELSRININLIAESVSRSGKLITVEEGTATGSVGNEIITNFICNHMDLLDTPPLKVASKDDIIPSSKQLEDQMLTSHQDIHRAVIKIMDQ